MDDLNIIFASPFININKHFNNTIGMVVALREFGQPSVPLMHSSDPEKVISQTDLEEVQTYVSSSDQQKQTEMSRILK